MKNKIISGLAIVGGLSGLVQAKTTAYIKNSDGTVTKQEVLTSDEAAQRQTEIRRQIQVLAEQNIIDTKRIAERQAQIDDLTQQDQDLEVIK